MRSPRLANLAGLHAVPVADPAARELRLGGAEPGVADVAMLADFALGAAVRARVGSARPLPTMTLTLDFDPRHLSPGMSVRGWGLPVSAGLGRAQGVLLRDDEPVGQCAATFAVPRQAPDLTALPWESAAAGDVDDPQSAETLVGAACTADGDVTVLRPDAAMLNRSGAVQGGVLFRMAATLPTHDARVVSGHVQFLAAGAAGQPVSAHPVVVGTTRRTLFVRSEVRQGDRLVASGSFVFRRG